MSENTGIEFMDFDYDLEGEVPDMELIPVGEQELVISRFDLKVAEFTDKKTGEERRAPIIDIIFRAAENGANHNPIYHSIWMPVAELPEDERMANKRRLKEFLEAVGMAWPPAAGADTFQADNFLDLHVWAQVARRESPEYGESRRITRFTRRG